MEKPVNKKAVGAISALAVLIIIAVAVFLGISANSGLNMKNYIKSDVTFSGYEGYGTIGEYDCVDIFSLVYDLENSSEEREKFAAEYAQVLKEGSGEGYIADYIDVSFDKCEYLKNGDTVTATVKVNYNYINDMGFAKKLRGEESYTLSYTVSGLESADVFDPFELVSEVIYDRQYGSSYVCLDSSYEKTVGDYSASSSGEEYYANLVITDGEGNTAAEIYYYTDMSSFETDGTVKVSVSCKETQYADDYGFIITPVEKEIKPTVLSFLTKSTVTETDYDSLKALADEYTERYDGTEYVKAYFAYNGEDGYKVNSLIFVYTRDEYYDDERVYTAVCFDDVKVNEADGSIPDINKLHLYTGYYSYPYAAQLIEAMNEDFSSLAVLNY